METRQEQSSVPTSGESKGMCLKPPCPIEVPSVPTCDDYEKIPKDIKEQIDLTFESAKKNADGDYEAAKNKAEDVKAQAKTAYDTADRKHSSEKKSLESTIEIAKKQLKLEYKKCHKDAIPQKCPPPDNPPPEFEAICVTQLKLNLAKKDVEFQKKIQKVNQEKSAADYAWQKAQEDYESELCVAEAVKEEAYLLAELEWCKALSKTLEKIE